MIRILFTCLVFSTPVWAVEPDEQLSDPILEQRARDISTNVRCVVCQNEPIDSSNAGVARDLRILIRERLTAGDTNAQVYDYLVARYGDYVLFKPPWKPSTYALWMAPFFILGGGALAVASVLRGRSKPTQTALSAAEKKRLDDIIGDGS